MAFDLQEQEQIAELKAFWHDYGRHIAVGVGVILAVFAGWKSWQAWQNHQSAQAAIYYSNIQQPTMDDASFKAGLNELKNNYAGTAYAARGALVAAQRAFNKKDMVAAESELKWVIDNAHEVVIRDTARLRLANVLIDSKKYDEALTQLKSAEEQSFGALYAETRGDVLALKGDAAGAAEAYKQALAKLTNKAANYKFVEIKLEALGIH